jgi:hypothetical protein
MVAHGKNAQARLGYHAARRIRHSLSRRRAGRAHLQLPVHCGRGDRATPLRDEYAATGWSATRFERPCTSQLEPSASVPFRDEPPAVQERHESCPRRESLRCGRGLAGGIGDDQRRVARTPHFSDTSITFHADTRTDDTTRQVDLRWLRQRVTLTRRCARRPTREQSCSSAE